MNRETVLIESPELEYVRRWTDAIEKRQFDKALSVVVAGLRFAKRKKRNHFVNHFVELRRITKQYLAEASGKEAASAVTPHGNTDGTAHCSFCGIGQAEVSMMLGGPGVFICDQCVERCSKKIAAIK